ncbi:glycosyltransferase [Ferrimonas senticii]|uniref:glycosyltransferase n=1 Tax=Ferrimonas senticii TaxID=394566 RepID=UPI0003F7FABE|nr:glycosyltransferase [Ferrimonas senticii]
MAIMQLVQRLAPGGLETMALALGQQLSNQQPVLLVSLEGSTESLLAQWPALAAGNPVIGLEKGSGFDWQLVRQLRQLCAEHQIRWLHSHHIGPLLYGALACAGSRTRQLHSHHDGWHLADRKDRWLTRWLLRCGGAASVAVAEQVAATLSAQGCRVDRVIANGVDANRFRPRSQSAMRQRLGLGDDLWLFGAVARMVPVKQLQLLVEALPSLPRQAQLLLAGDGPCRPQLQQLANDLGVAERCHFLGHCDQPQYLYPALDCYCLCSKAEGAPMALWEAQSSGVPVLCADVGNCRANLCPDSGRIVAADQWPQALWQQMQQQSAQTAQQPAVAPAARAFALAHGSLLPMASGYQQLMQEIER